MGSYCSQCGKAVPADARHCSNCGHSLGGAFAGGQAVPPTGAQRRLFRPRAGRMIAGVCQGVALAYGWDPTLVRVIFVLTACLSGIGLIVYVVLWVAAPEEPLLLPTAAVYTPPANPQT